MFLIRHGQTSSNATGARLYNPGLTELGRDQARRLAERLGPQGLTLVLASPLLRALQTAAPIAAASGAPLVLTNDLVEVNTWGPYRGLARTAVTAGFPEARIEPEMPAIGWAYPGPEPPEAAAARAARLVAQLEALGPDQRVAVVGHGTFTGLLLHVWLRLPSGRRVVWAQDNAAVTTLALEADGTLRLMGVNDTAHLA